MELRVLDTPSEERFTRIEEKFFLPMDLRDQFMELVEANLPASYPDHSTKFNMIESLYFDTPELSSFSNHFQQLPYRFKLRARRYGPNGQWDGQENSTVFIELKTKQGTISDKFRVKVKPEDLNNLKSGVGIPNIKKPSAAKINEVLTQSHLSPSAKIVYRRFAFEKEAVRLTVDDQVQFNPELSLSSELIEKMKSSNWWKQAENMSQDIFKSGMSLVELKHFGQTPQWLANFMERNHLSFTTFSKYCFSMANLISKGAKA